jgi:hypothetical protein
MEEERIKCEIKLKLSSQITRLGSFASVFEAA